MNDHDIIATASTDAPEVLDTDVLDAATGGVEYGGKNTCEPVKPKGGDWINILSVSSGPFIIREGNGSDLKAS